MIGGFFISKDIISVCDKIIYRFSTAKKDIRTWKSLSKLARGDFFLLVEADSEEADSEEAGPEEAKSRLIGSVHRQKSRAAIFLFSKKINLHRNREVYRDGGKGLFK